MAFSRECKTEALLLSARRCCVCRRFRGVGVQVHHIVSESNGGSNTLDNAIVLCLDCHMAAGHYNPQHPIGIKFSPEELKSHRDSWYEKVQSSGMRPLETEFEGLYSRHLLCVDRKAANECLDGDGAALPFLLDSVYDSPAARFMRWVIADEAYPDGDPPPTPIVNEDYERLSAAFARGEAEKVLGEFFGDDDTDSSPFSPDAFSLVQEEGASGESELRKSPDADVPTIRRLMTASDVGSAVNSHLLRQMASEGTDIGLVGEVHDRADPCSGGHCRYCVARRRLYLFCEIKSVSDRAFTVLGLTFQESGSFDQVNLRKLRSDETRFSERGTPPLRLEPGRSLLIPECTMLSPKTGVPLRLNPGEETRDIDYAQGQTFGHYSGGRNPDDYWIVGPRSEVVGVKVEAQSDVGVHSFDPTNTFILNRFWRIGSCPHLLYWDSGGRWRYLRELFPTADRVIEHEQVEVPEEARRMRIVELEMEVAYISAVKVNGNHLLPEPRILERGDFIEFDVGSGDELVISGGYMAAVQALGIPRTQIWWKRSLIHDELYELNGDSTVA